MYVEIKGWFRYEDKVKMIAVKECNPDLDIRIVLANNNTKDTRWCTKHGFIYAVRQIPATWFD